MKPNEPVTINWMLRNNIRLQNLTSDQLIELKRDNDLTGNLWFAVEKEIIRRLTLGLA